MTYPNGVTVSYTYDPCQRLKEECVKDKSGRLLAKYSYTLGKAGERTAVTEEYDGKKIDICYGYDELQRLVSEEITSGSSKLINTYAYDNVSNRISKKTEIIGDCSVFVSGAHKENAVAGEYSYTYNALNQLVKEEFKADALSNVLSDAQETVQENISDEALYNDNTGSKTENYTTQYIYDDNGNLVKTSGYKNVEYIYDYENHLIKVSVNEGGSVNSESYTYDFNGNRLSKTVSCNKVSYEGVESEVSDRDEVYLDDHGKTVFYINDISEALTYVSVETDDNGNLIRSYVRGDELISYESGGSNSLSEYSDVYTGSEAGTLYRYYIYDGHGSVRQLADLVGNITDSYGYDAYGSLIYSAGSSENEFLYAGEQYNYLSELYYLRARYMNPSTGTFISADSYQGSLQDPVSLHKYLYANANPVMNIDPSGYNTGAVEKSVGKLAIALVVAGILTSAVITQNAFMMNGFMRFIKALDEGPKSIFIDIFVAQERIEDDLEVFPADPPKPEDIITTVPEVLLEKDLGEILTAPEFKRELVSIFPQLVIEQPVISTIEII
ncbi:RHS repeat-associated core domain-containing protein [Eubacterium ruminantium]|nr:RHS repeat-associated core domain-containing protein [Eubacterium ruminantium]